MDKNINLVDILKDVPNGTKLWSPICGECEFTEILPIGIYQIQVKHIEGNIYNFTAQGKYSDNSEAECLLFPSKENRDWSAFKTLWRHKHFEPFQKVLVPYSISINDKTFNKTEKCKWRLSFYSHYDEDKKKHVIIDGWFIEDSKIIPYDGNEDKLGKPVK